MTRRPWRDRLRRSSVRIAAALAIVLACGTAAAESVRIEIDGVTARSPTASAAS
jgi:hypothetical protein